MVRREASVINSLYKDSRSRSFHSEFARMVCVRCVIQVVAMEAVAPTKEPNAAAIAVTTVDSIVRSFVPSRHGSKARGVPETSASASRLVKRSPARTCGSDGTRRPVEGRESVNVGAPAGGRMRQRASATRVERCRVFSSSNTASNASSNSATHASKIPGMAACSPGCKLVDGDHRSIATWPVRPTQTAALPHLPKCPSNRQTRQPMKCPQQPHGVPSSSDGQSLC